jgi:hypothetical protein
MAVVASQDFSRTSMASELIEKDIYNGKYHVVHNPDAKGSQPRYVVNGTKPKGVTTILGAVLAKDFVGWALDCMEEAIIGRFIGESMEVTRDEITEAKGESSRRRDTGGSTGTIVHGLVEKYLRGEEVPMSKVSKEAQSAFIAFIKWFDTQNAEILNIEDVVYSPSYEYAGTYDCLLKLNGKVYLCDLKTTNSSKKAPKGVYPEYFAQLGAYSYAYEEQRLHEMANGETELPDIDGLMVISAKKNGKLDIVTNEDLGLTISECQYMFTMIVQLYHWLEETSNKLGGI